MLLTTRDRWIKENARNLLSSCPSALWVPRHHAFSSILNIVKLDLHRSPWVFRYVHREGLGGTAVFQLDAELDDQISLNHWDPFAVEEAESLLRLTNLLSSWSVVLFCIVFFSAFFS